MNKTEDAGTGLLLTRKGVYCWYSHTSMWLVKSGFRTEEEPIIPNSKGENIVSLNISLNSLFWRDLVVQGQHEDNFLEFRRHGPEPTLNVNGSKHET